MKRRALLGFIPALLLAAALLALLAGGTENASAQVTPTLSISVEGGYTDIDEGGTRVIVYTLNNPAPAGGINISDPGIPTGGILPVSSTTILEGQTTLKIPLTADDDNVYTPGRVVTLVYPNYNNLPTSGSLTITLTVNDNDGLVFDPESVTVTEGATATYTVALGTVPTGNVTVTPSSDNSDVTVSPATLTFTTQNWDTAQTVRVSAASDSDAATGRATLSHSASGGGYGGAVIGNVLVTVIDTTPRTLVSNLGQTVDAFGNDGHDHAQAFTSGDNALGYTLTSAGIFFRQVDTSNQVFANSVVTIRSDSGGSPGTVLATLTDPSSGPTAYAASTFTAPGQGLDLEPNTQYWLVFDITGDIPGTNQVGNTTSDNEDAGAASGWSISNQGHYRNRTHGGGWLSFQSSRVISISGFPITPPTIPPLPPADPEGFYRVAADWPLIPSGINPGNTFRLLFVTSTKRDAKSTDIADYNTHVQQAAAGRDAQVAIKEFAAGFRVVGCTTAVTARANTDSEATDTDAPIYWLNGVKVADNYADFYDDTWDNQVEASIREESGAQASATDVFTGCFENGTRTGVGTVLPLGSGSLDNDNINTGSPVTGGSPLDAVLLPRSIMRPFYALSPVFLVEDQGAHNARLDLSVLDDNSPAGFIFRVCPEGRTCDPNAGDGDTNWVPTLNPIVKLQEGGDSVSYQYKFHWPGDTPESGTQVCENGACHTVSALWVTFNVDAFGDYRNLHRHDHDRLNCFDSRNTGSGGHGADTWGAYIKHRANWGSTDLSVPTNELWLHGTADGSNVGTYPERTAGAKVVSDMWGGCPPWPNSYSTSNHDVWQTVTIGAGHDPDAFGHDFVMYHQVNWADLDRMGGLYRDRDPNVKVHIVDDDAWEQNIEVAPFDGTNTTGPWTLLERGGLQKALPEAIAKETTYQFKARLVTNRDDGSRTEQDYLLGPHKSWISIWVDEPHRTRASDPPYGINIRWGQGIPLNEEVVINIRAEAKASKGPLVIRQRAVALRFRTDTDLPERLGADINDPVTTIGTDASRPSNRYWFENYEHATCVDCNLMNQITPVVNITGNSQSYEGDSVFFKLTAEPSGREVPVNVKIAAEGDFGVATGYRTVTIPAGGIKNLFLTTENDDKDELDGSATITILPGDGYSVGPTSTMTSYISDDDDYSESPLVRYAALIERIKTDLQSPNYHGEAYDLTRVLKTLGVPQYANAPGSEVSVGEATNRRTQPRDNPHWEGIADALRYKLNHDVWAAANPLPAGGPEITISGGSDVTEGGDATFTITANRAPASPITVNVGVMQSGDWGATGAATVSLSGAPTTYTIATTNDKVDEADGSVTATVHSGRGYTVGAPSSATVAVADDDDYSEAPLVKYAALIERIKTDAQSPNYDNEGYDLRRVLKTLGVTAFDHAPGPPVSVGEATNRRTKPADNPHWEGIAEAIQYKLDYDAWAHVNPPPTSDPVITISGGSGITEGGSATFTISASPAPTNPITVNVGVSQTGDFGATGAATVSVSGATATYTIATSDDQVDEADGSVTATVQTGTGYTVGTASTATVTVADDDVPEITISGGSGITEGGSATFTISASPAPASPITVNIGVSETGDWDATGAATVSVNSATTTYTIATSDDEVDEADGSVSATVQAGNGYTVGTASTATVAVSDDDYDTAPLVEEPEAPLVKYATLVQSFYDRITANAAHGNDASGGWNKRFLKAMGHPEYVNYPQAAVTVAQATDLYNHGGPGANTAWEGTAEAIQYKLDYDAGTINPPPDPDPEITISGGAGITEGGTASFTITASPAPASAITVNIGVSQSGSWGATGAATVSVSGATTTYTIATSDDEVDEADGSVTATVQAGTGYTVGTASTASVTVADDDDPPATPEITISGGSGITEGGSATFTISASPVPASAITVNIGVSESGDWDATGSATVSVNSATTTYTIATSDDQVDEADGSVTATVQSGSGYTVGTASTATVTVADDDDPPATPEITISGGSGITEGGTASFTISASPVPTSAITVNIGVSESGDWDATGAATVSVNAATTTYTIATGDDQVDEADGSVTATVQSGTGYTIGTASTASVTVADDDDPPATPEITISGGSGITEGGTASFTITASPAPASAITVNIGVSESGDWDATGAATVSVSGATTTYTIATGDDQVDEADGSVTATVQSGTGYTVGTASTATVTVADDDDPPATPEIIISGGSGITEGGSATFTISASPVPASAITVNIGVSESGDWDATGAATVSVNSATTTYTIATGDDQVDEADGSVTATVQSGNGYTVGTASTATVAVADDDDPVEEKSVTISIEDASASENASDLVFRVTLSEASDEDITVQWRTLASNDPDRRARGGQDYWDMSGEIKIRAGETSGTGAVWLNQDSEDEPDELFTVYLHSPAGATLDREEGTMTIIDDD